MLEAIKKKIRGGAFVRPAIFLKSLITKPVPQNEEGVILDRLLARYAVPHTFVEFGFSGWEFNCAGLVSNWEGLLLDGDGYNVTIADIILPKKVKALQQWITLDNLSVVGEWLKGRDLGILSIDVDGNDYWFLENLITLRPAMIISEYNSFLGQRSVTVPYDPAFDRRAKHPNWTYFGASLAALTKLAEQHGYALVDVTPAGINAFFMRRDLLGPGDVVLDAADAYRPRTLPPEYDHTTEEANVADYPFIEI